MASRLKRTVLLPIRHFFPERVGIFISRLLSKSLTRELYGMVTDKFLERLLKSMDLAFCLCESYRENIKDFEGRYVFRTADNLVAATATFKDGDMKVHEKEIDDWDVRVTFKDAAALRAFILSRDQDILDSILANDVETDGNLNYVCKFAFMVRDLGHRLGVG
ncbi:MAG: hypothetical protein IMF11_03220 [Proteobacteria bacterium]|nr:hypothetical protein [Pseudomonadota bacterium]